MISPEVLRRYPYFAGLTADQMVTVANTAEEISAPAEHFFFHEGDSLTHLYIVLEGEVAILIEVPAQNKQVVTSTIGPGEVFSWSGLVPPYQATAAAKTLGVSRVLSFDCQALRQAFETDCQLGYIMMQMLAQVIRDRMRDLRIETLASMA
jgi:CRP-like cAMP-binding protein